MFDKQMLCIVTDDWPGQARALQAAWQPLDALFADIGRVHFASVALLPPRPGRQDKPSLMLELAVDDGLPPAELIGLLVEQGLDALWPLYGGYPGAPAQAAQRRHWLRGFLLQWTNRAAGGFVGNRDRTVAQIRQEADLFRSARRKAASLPTRLREDRTAVARELTHWVASQAAFAWTRTPAPVSFWRGRGFGPALRRWIVLIPLGLAFIVVSLFYVLVLLVLAWWLVSLRLWLDRPRDEETPRAQQVHPSIEADEAELVGRVGHMISLTEVRWPVSFNAAALRILLPLIGGLGHIWFTEGRLGTAAGIKFGHWHLIDRGQRLIFCSNFDGSFGGYLDEFIAGASIGVNLVWRWTRLLPRAAAAVGQPPVVHARRFPPTRLGAFGGCKNETWFKAFARDSMLPHLHRFEAYDASNEDIARATALRDALAAPRTPVTDDRIMRALES